MALRLPRALAVAALSLTCLTSAYNHTSSIDMTRAQLAIMEDRPKDCPPWYDVAPPSLSAFLLEILTILCRQLRLQPSYQLLRPIRAVQRVQRQVHLPSGLRW